MRRQRRAAGLYRASTHSCYALAHGGLKWLHILWHSPPVWPRKGQDKVMIRRQISASLYWASTHSCSVLLLLFSITITQKNNVIQDIPNSNELFILYVNLSFSCLVLAAFLHIFCETTIDFADIGFVGSQIGVRHPSIKQTQKLHFNQKSSNIGQSQLLGTPHSCQSLGQSVPVSH